MSARGGWLGVRQPARARVSRFACGQRPGPPTPDPRRLKRSAAWSGFARRRLFALFGVFGRGIGAAPVVPFLESFVAGGVRLKSQIGVLQGLLVGQYIRKPEFSRILMHQLQTCIEGHVPDLRRIARLIVLKRRANVGRASQGSVTLRCCLPPNLAIVNKAIALTLGTVPVCLSRRMAGSSPSLMS